MYLVDFEMCCCLPDNLFRTNNTIYLVFGSCEDDVITWVWLVLMSSAYVGHGMALIKAHLWL